MMTGKTIDRQRSPRRRWGLLTAMAIGALALGIVMTACKSEEPPPPKEVVRPVKTHTVVSANLAIDQTFPAQVRAGRRVDLAFKVAGPLVEGPIEEGQQVKKSQVIAKILPRDFKINLDQAQARALEAEQQYKRYKDLYVRKQVSKAEFDRFTAARDVARAQLADARNALGDTFLKAPFGGVIAKRYVENFEEVQAKQPIVSLQDMSQIELLVDVPETTMARIRAKEASDIYAKFDAIPDKQFDLTIKEYSTEADPQTQTYQVVLQMTRPEGANILPGMTATVTGTAEKIGAGDPDVIIPAIAVLETPDGKAFVWLVDTEKLMVKKGEVTVGPMTGSDNIVIKEGLKGGEVIAVAGMTRLQEGMQISIWKE